MRYVEVVRREGPRVIVEGHGAVLAHVAAALVAQGIAPPDLHVEAPDASKTSSSASPGT